MDLELAGKSVVITGGARGIGFACAEGFAREGARIAILDVSADDLAEAEAKLRDMGADVITREIDVANSQAVDTAHASVIEAFGGIDIGFNNAGIGSKFKPIEDTTDEDWDRVVDINLKGIFLCVRAQVRHMKPRGRGVIVCTASNVAFSGAPGATPYVAAKHGIIGIVRTVALELAQTGVRINAVAPGAIQTRIGGKTGLGTFEDPFPDALIRQGLPIGRWGQPHEIADAVLWLASPRSNLALGEALVMDGGFLAQ
ncbi:SDR family NAD(P)-dependent oxidoreductase [Sphingobium nicotianae]|uniref:SDR family oxidoreductase n=1 Tax=Sphingobium nicotianae TaxID=2782607 RepID=A0A9X1DCA0_9SPHN|nr:SDR family NAD(P)-dependent oxidoreductase [Sphingobium nicotianae]MBT2187376.1 SDR family oxidoreductase [Sphingobium nicotianae]